MKVLATIIVPPHLSVSGAARAAETLSAALASRCDTTIGSMMASAPASEKSGAVGQVPAKAWCPPGFPWGSLPNRYSSLFYRSDISDIVRAGGYDLVHIHNALPSLEFERVTASCHAMGIPYVVSTHGFNE